MTLVFGLMVVMGLALTAHHWVSERRKLLQLATYGFPDHLQKRLQATYPHLTPEECAKVLDGLRQFFAISILAGGRRIAMPSQAVDEAWHEFILSTRAYQAFCQRVLGRFLHHTPAEAMLSPRYAQQGIRLAWRLACGRERIDPKRPARLPLLFAIDGALRIPGGYTYALNCGLGGDRYCAGSIGCSSGCGGGGCSGDGGCGGGCGGD